MTGTIAVARWTPERVTLVATRETWEGLLAEWRADPAVEDRRDLRPARTLAAFEAAYRAGQQAGETVSVSLTPELAAVVRGR